MRGEYRTPKPRNGSRLGSPPHARGILANLPDSGSETGITPACAGNTIRSRNTTGISRDHPRMRGEYPSARAFPRNTVGSPPHARGIRKAAETDRLAKGITPACAGNTLVWLIRTLINRDHPRMRGEYGSAESFGYSVQGSPPHARGILVFIFCIVRYHGITPACAGNTRGRLHYRERYGDHPRMRGEYFGDCKQYATHKGSPPHARGIH